MNDFTIGLLLVSPLVLLGVVIWAKGRKVDTYGSRGGCGGGCSCGSRKEGL